MRIVSPVIVFVLLATSPVHARAQAAVGDWPAYGRDPGGTRFSPLTQIDTANVARLKLAWVYRTGDVLHSNGRFEATPLLVDGRLYVSTPLGRVSALDPATGVSGR